MAMITIIIIYVIFWSIVIWYEELKKTKNNEKILQYRNKYVLIGILFNELKYVEDIGENYCYFTDNLDKALKFNNKKDAIEIVGKQNLSVLKIEEYYIP